MHLITNLIPSACDLRDNVMQQGCFINVFVYHQNETRTFDISSRECFLYLIIICI